MNIALILAGGTGKRLGEGIPKQYIEIEGKPIIAYCLETFFRHEKIDKVQIVAERTWHSLIAKWAMDETKKKMQGFSEPGKTRQLSIWNGLQDVLKYSQEKDVIMIHDAARPLVSERIITDCLEACKEHEGVLTALPVKDTIYYGTNGKIEALLDRNRLIAGQAPEAFQLGKYYHANEKLLPDDILKINGSTEPAILAGMDICCIKGEERNFKVTTKEDLEYFKQVLEREGKRG